MNTMQFLMAVLNWLQADPSHVIVAATLADSLIPTPDPRTPLGKLYKVLELFALSFMHAKETGIPPMSAEALAEQVAAVLERKKNAAQVPTLVVNPAPAAPIPAAPAAPVQQ